MARIASFGGYIPDAVITNQELAAEFDVSPDWIRDMTGIEERRRAAPGETVTDLAHKAALAALKKAGIAATDLGGIVVGSGTPPRQFPGIAAELQARLGAASAFGFDIPLASVGGLFALAVAADLAQRHGPVLALGAERMTEIIQRPPRVKETAILFGDGAGAAVVLPGSGPRTVQAIRLGTDGAKADGLSLEFGGPLRMDGRTVILQANRKLRGVIEEILCQNGKSPAEIDLFLFHQANLNLLRQVGRATDIPEDRVFVNIQHYGNTSSASLLIAAAEAEDQGKLGPDVTALLAAFGSGMSWGGLLLSPAAPLAEPLLERVDQELRDQVRSGAVGVGQIARN